MSQLSKPIAFVIMPFSDDFTDVYEDLIQAGLSDYDVIRADSRLDETNILGKIIRGIEAAELVVADLTTLNPNVMYELGVAHALGKPTVMITQSLVGLPFDVRSYPAHVYSTHFKRAGELRDRLREIGEQHRARLIEFGNPVNDFRTVSPGVSPTAPATRVPARTIPLDPPSLTLDEATSEFQQIFELLGSETDLLTAHITHAATETTQAQQSKFGSERLSAIRGASAAHIAAYAKAIGVQQERLHHTWRRFGEGMLETAQLVEESQKAVSYTSVAKLESAVNASLDQILRFRSSMANLSVVAPDMTGGSESRYRWDRKRAYARQGISASREGSAFGVAPPNGSLTQPRRGPGSPAAERRAACRN